MQSKFSGDKAHAFAQKIVTQFDDGINLKTTADEQVTYVAECLGGAAKALAHICGTLILIAPPPMSNEEAVRYFVLDEIPGLVEESIKNLKQAIKESEEGANENTPV